MPNLKLTANPRTETGSRASRRLRREGLVPGVVYGKGNQATAFVVEDREFRRLLREGARGHLVDLTVGDDTAVPTLLKELQRDPIRGDLIHIDLQEVDLTATVDSPVPVVLTGSAVGVREGGVLDQTLREIVVRALPSDLPEAFELDVSELDVGDTVNVSDLVAPEGVEVLGDPEASIASITLPRAAVEEEEVPEEEAEELEGEEVAEGEEAAEEAAEGSGEE
jgi:large subunit ribosomal protein L25